MCVWVMYLFYHYHLLSSTERKKAAITETENRKIQNTNKTIIICWIIDFSWLKMW